MPFMELWNSFGAEQQVADEYYRLQTNLIMDSLILSIVSQDMIVKLPVFPTFFLMLSCQIEGNLRRIEAKDHCCGIVIEQICRWLMLECL